MKRRRGVNDIRTLGHRRQSSQDQRALLRASVIEAELHRLGQERRLLLQRLESLEQRSADLMDERNRLVDSLDVRQSRDRAPAPGGFRLLY